MNDDLFPSADEEGAPGAPEHKRVEEESQEEKPVEKSLGKQKPWSRSRELVHGRAYSQQEALHHSKEVWKSPEEEELQMMAGRDPEEGSAAKKTEVRVCVCV